MRFKKINIIYMVISMVQKDIMLLDGVMIFEIIKIIKK